MSGEPHPPVDPGPEDRAAAVLVKRFQAGDMEAFGELYKLYFDRVFAYLRVALKNTHDAEDVAQQSFTQALESLHRYRARAGLPFRSWLFAIVRNRAIDALRARDRLEPMDPAELEARIERDQRPEDSELRALGWITDRDMLIFIERLSLPQRQVLALRFLLGMTTKQCAVSLDRTPENVRSLQSRALKFLRDRLTAVGREPADVKEERAESVAAVRQATVLRKRRFALY